MSLKLGEVLLEQRLIDEKQLKQALDAQVVHGGHLGTCLVELGFLDLDRLAQVLAEKFRVSNADRTKILAAAPEVIETLSPKLAEKYLVIPFEQNGGTLHVAMIDPSNLSALDELSFASGLKIEAWSAPELLIHRAMEVHYGIPRQPRGVKMADQTEPKPVLDEPAVVTDRPETKADEIQAPRTARAADADPMTDPIFDAIAVEQPRPRALEQREIQQEAQGRQLEDGKLTVDWVRCELFSVNLDESQFDKRQGVYILWHGSQRAALRIGQGYIRTELHTVKMDPRILAARVRHPILVTWVALSRELRDGVERYLIDTLEPQVAMDSPEAAPIPVNLPI